MTLPDAKALYPVVEATWPPARSFREGAWTIREGLGGGSRVSSATAEATVGAAGLAVMEASNATLGQVPLVMVRQGENGLDSLLADAGYVVKDPVVLYAAPVEALTGELGPASAFAHWPRLAITADLWAEGGIGPERLAVMDRVAGPKAAILARSDDQPAGAAFVAIHDGIAMIHAVEVIPRLRRRGAARNMMRAAANWAQDMGATHVALAVTERNAAARPLYASLGMQVVGHYHYRIKEPAKGLSR